MVCFIGGRIFRFPKVGGAIALLALALAAALLVEASNVDLDAASETNFQQSRLGVLLQSAGLGLGLLYAFAAFGASTSLGSSTEVFGILLLSVCGLLLAAVANDLWLLYAAAELAVLPMCAMLFASRHDVLARRGGTKHLMMVLLSSALLLYGMVLLQGAAGTSNLAGVRDAFQSVVATEQSAARRIPLGEAGLVLTLAALGYRLAAAPFHFGIADAFEGAAPWNAALVATFSQMTAVVVVIRGLIPNLVGVEATGQLVCLILSIASLTVGGGLALAQTNIRRTLAYMAVAHAGMVLAGLAAGFWDASAAERSFERTNSLPGGTESCLFYLGSYLLATGGLVAVFVYLARGDRQLEHVEDLAGLISREPLAAVCASTCLLSLAGVPPLPGFWGRLFVLSSALAVHLPPERQYLPLPSPAFVFLAILSIGGVLMTAAVSLRVVIVMVFEGQVARPEPSGGQPSLAAAVLAGMLTLGAGLLPGPIVGCLNRAVTQEHHSAAPRPAVRFTPRGGGTIPVVESERDIPAPRARRAGIRR
jgi:NADH-quinone oxidoreductase subunit N